ISARSVSLFIWDSMPQTRRVRSFRRPGTIPFGNQGVTIGPPLPRRSHGGGNSIGRPAVGSTMVRYKVRPERADENERLLRAAYEQLGRDRPDGLHYATFKLPDGVSFMHVVFETEQPGRILGQVAAFQAFQADIGDRCDDPPAVTEITLVGSYGFGS